MNEATSQDRLSHLNPHVLPEGASSIAHALDQRFRLGSAFKQYLSTMRKMNGKVYVYIIDIYICIYTRIHTHLPFVAIHDTNIIQPLLSGDIIQDLSGVQMFRPAWSG